MESADRHRRPHHRLALFLFVFFVPFLMLAALAIRTLNQDRELATRRTREVAPSRLSV